MASSDRRSRRVVRAAVVAIAVSALVGCDDAGSVTKTTPATSEDTSATPLRYVAFGDSWSYGGHCNGCRPFPELYAAGLEEQTDRPVDFTNLTENGGTAASLAADMRQAVTVRETVASADVIVISTGGNDMEPAGLKWKDGSCGGSDGIGCFKDVADRWHADFDSMLTQIDELRAGRPTSVRIVTMSNEFISDPGLIDFFGRDFGPRQGAKIVAMQRDALCEAAEAHDALCVDLRPVLNGRHFDRPQDVNTQYAMQRVADALLATGTPELD